MEQELVLCISGSYINAVTAALFTMVDVDPTLWYLLAT